MTRLDTISETDVSGWWYAGVRTVTDLRDTGNAAIAAHHAGAPQRERQATELARMVDGLARVAGEVWVAQVWWRDPRFRDLLPRSDATVAEIINGGSLAEQQELWVSTDQLEARIERLAALPLEEAVERYVEAISGQHGIRLEALLAYRGLGGRDPIYAREAAAMLRVSYQRISQISDQMYRNRDRARPPAGIWIPQVDAAITDGWPDGYTTVAIGTIRVFFRRSRDESPPCPGGCGDSPRVRGTRVLRCECSHPDMVEHTRSLDGSLWRSFATRRVQPQ